jgi:NADPH-dependent 2,4-dienoyl-CoA reductase/sulfur reductase-like enzyme
VVVQQQRRLERRRRALERVPEDPDHDRPRIEVREHRQLQPCETGTEDDASLMKHVLMRLSESLPGEVRTTLIDQNDAFTFGFSKLDILFGRKTTADVRLPYSDLSKDAVEFRQERVTSIDPETRQVTTDGGSYDADFLVVALGADYDFHATPGFAADGVEYYAVAGAERIRKALSQAILDLLHERGIDYLPNQQIVELDPDNNAARLADGGSISYDLLHAHSGGRLASREV